MSHLDYYKYQAEARGVRALEDVRRIAGEKAWLYERLVQPWLPADQAGPIAELACGHGSFLQWLKQGGYSNLAGVDSSPEQIQFAGQVGAQVERGDVLEWLARQPRDHFGALVAIDLVEHLAKDVFMNFLPAAQAALAPGGSLILRLPNGESPLVGMNLFNDITHVWTYTPNCLATLGRMHGFAEVEFKDEGGEMIRDHRWLKVPLARLCTAILKLGLRAATRERVAFLSPHLWARFIKSR